MTRTEETQLAEILSACANVGMKVSRAFILCKNLKAGIEEPKTKTLAAALEAYGKEGLTKKGLDPAIISQVVASMKEGKTVAQMCRAFRLTHSQVYYIITARHAGAPAEGYGYEKYNLNPTRAGRPKKNVL